MMCSTYACVRAATNGDKCRHHYEMSLLGRPPTSPPSPPRTKKGGGMCRLCGRRSADSQIGNGVKCLHCINAQANTPPICVCPSPDPDAIGQCRGCHRPYKPDHEGLTRVRDAWLKKMGVGPR